MEVHLVGHATILLKDKNFSLICDPWLEGGSLTNGTIWQYPPRIKSTKDFDGFKYIYISHDHDDHCHIETSKFIDKDTPIYILNHKENKNLLYKLKDLKYKNLIIIEPWVKTKIEEDVFITIFPSDTDYLDSSALFNYKNYNIYHGNDNVLKPATYEKIGKLSKIDLAFMPYAALSGYPSIYEFDTETKIRLAEKKKKAKLEEFYKHVRALNAKVSVPAAGDLCVIGGDVPLLGIGTPEDAINYAPNDIKNRIIDMRPNDIFSMEKGFIPYKNRNDWNYTQEDQERFSKLPHVKKVIDETNKWLLNENIDGDNFKKLVKKYFEDGLKEFENLAKEVGDYIFTLKSTNNKNLNFDISIDFNNLTVSEKFNENYSKKISIRPEILCKIIKREYLWSDAHAGLRMSVHRKPIDNWNNNFWKWIFCLDSHSMDFKPFFNK